MRHPGHLTSVQPGAQDLPGSAGGRPPRVVREGAVGHLECPGCGEPLRFGLPTGATVRSPGDIAAIIQAEMATLEREEVRVVALDAKNHVLAVETVYVGNVSSAVVRVGELFRDAVRLGASGIVLVHNHPSGDPNPSPDDLHLTAEALAAGRLLDIDLLDHIVIGRGSWVSLRDRGVLFDRVSRHHKSSPDDGLGDAA